MPAVICPAGTPVPEGLDDRDLPAFYVVKGAYGDEIGEVVAPSSGFMDIVSATRI